MSNRSRVSRSKIVLSIMLLAFATATVSVPLTAETSSKPRESATATEPLPITGNRDSKLSVAQLFDSLTIDVAIDAKQNQRYIKADDQFDSFVYSETIQNNTKVIQPASENIMGWWKGNKTLKEIYMMEKGYFEETDQFAPIFLIVDLTNNRATPVQIKNAYLDVSASATDLQPYLEIGSIDRIGCDVGSYNPEFPFTNYGWGTVRGANMIYSFGKASSAQFTASLGTFEYTVDVSVEEGLRTSSLNINRLKAGHFSCASKAVVKSCLATLRGSGIFGSLTDSVYLSDVTVFVDTTGRFDYEWLSIDGTSNKRSSPFVIDIPLLHFDLGSPECGAPEPIDRNNKPIVLPLDKKNYRMSLDWRSQLIPRQNKRFTLALSAPKSSHHLAKVVVELSDGSLIASMPLDILYFTPRIPPPPKE